MAKERERKHLCRHSVWNLRYGSRLNEFRKPKAITCSTVGKMHSNRINIDKLHLSAVAGEHEDVVRYLMEKYGLKRRWVRNLMSHHGNDQGRLEQAARESKGT